MIADLALAAVILWMVGGGAFQLWTGRDAWIASFRSQREPSEKEIRVSGALALVVGLALVPVWISLIFGNRS